MDKSIPYTPSRLDSTLFLQGSLNKYLERVKFIIDIGCGRLFFFNYLKNTKFRGKYLGIDIQQPPVPAKAKFDVRTVRANFLKYPTRKDFDMAVCLWVLEHIKNDKEAMRKISKILKPKGVLILAVPSIWTWPFEFGRHGYHYYNQKLLKIMAAENGLEIIESYSSAGLLGFIFMIIYNWPRYFLLLPALIIYRLMKVFGLMNISWKNFSIKLISNTIYFYHRYERAVKIHNKIVASIVKLDNKFKIFPASYILVLKKP